MKTLYRIDIEPKKFWLIFMPSLLLAACLMLLITFFAVDKILMPQLTGVNNRGEISVPDMAGMTLDSAKSICFKQGFRVSELRSEYSDDVDANCVISQDPEAGNMAKQGRHILVVLSKGSEIAEVPSVKGLLEGPAKRALRTAGFTNISVVTQYDSKVKADCGIGTEPAEGSVTSREAKVTLLLSRGDKPAYSEVPDLNGMKLSDASALIDSAGLRVGSLTYETASGTEPGVVIRQSAASGAKVPLESSVNLVVSVE